MKAANLAGLKLKIPIYSIDRLIYESLVENNTHSANKITKHIEDEFEYAANKEDLVYIPEEGMFGENCIM